MNYMNPVNPDFGDAAGAVGSGMIGVFLILYFMFLLCLLAFSAVTYVLHSLGQYTIAKRRGIRNPWLAWIPLCNMWILGSISDQYQYVVKGKIRNRRKLLLCLGIVAFAGYYLWAIEMIANLVVGRQISVVLGVFGGGIVLAAAAVVLTVFQSIAYYDLYRSCNPGSAVVYLVMSVIFSVPVPFFVFACRKKDLGMPPRKQSAPQQVVIPTVEPVVDPAVVEKVVIPTVEPVVDPTVVEKVVIPTVEPTTEEGFARPEEFEEE